MKMTEKVQVAAMAALILLVLDWGQTEKVWANNVTYPTKNYTFSPLTTISSSQVNSNFDQLFNELAGNVGAANLLADAVTTSKIADLNVTTAKLASQAVTLAKIYQTGNTDQFLRADGTYSAPASRVPTGTVVLWTTDTAPTSWLFCRGQAVSRSTYAGLFSVISTTYGTGDGSTTFNVPDCMGRVVAGKETSATLLTATYFGKVTGQNGATLNNKGGLESHQLVLAEIPSHTHTYNKFTLFAGANYARNDVASFYFDYAAAQATGSAGSDGSHANVQPTIILNYIIKY